MYSQLLVVLLPLWSALLALPFLTRSIEAATVNTCDKCNFDGMDAEDCRVYGQLGDGNLIGWHRASQACLDVFDIKDEAIDPELLSSMFPNPDGTGGNPSSFVNYLRFEDGSVASGIKAGFPQFFVESSTVPGKMELKGSITVDGTSYDCSSSESSCWTAIRSYFSVEPGATEMAGVGRSLYDQQAVSREKEQSLVRIRLCSDGNSTEHADRVDAECRELHVQVRQVHEDNPDKFCSAFGLGPAGYAIPGCDDMQDAGAPAGSSAAIPFTIVSGRVLRVQVIAVMGAAMLL